MKTVSNRVLEKIKSFPDGTNFGYEQLGITKAEFTAAAKAIERLLKQETIKRLSKGIFYKPKQTVFGELKPVEYEILKSYLFKNGKRIAYITSTYLYNQLGLTTQVPSTIKIACKIKRIYVNRIGLKAMPVKSYMDVTDSNFQLLGLLDALKDIKKIPDSDINMVFRILSNKINSLSEKEVNILVEISLLYPPRVRALLGAVLEQQNSEKFLSQLKASLNPFTKYSLGVNPELFKNLENWYIV